MNSGLHTSRPLRRLSGAQISSGLLSRSSLKTATFQFECNELRVISQTHGFGIFHHSNRLSSLLSGYQYLCCGTWQQSEWVSDTCYMSWHILDTALASGSLFSICNSNIDGCCCLPCGKLVVECSLVSLHSQESRCYPLPVLAVPPCSPLHGKSRLFCRAIALVRVVVFFCHCRIHDHRSCRDH